MISNLCITAANAEEIGLWIKSNLSASTFKHDSSHICMGMRNGRGETWYGAIDIWFASADERLLFDCRWRGDFFEDSPSHWDETRTIVIEESGNTTITSEYKRKGGR